MTSETREIMHGEHAHPVHSTKLYWVIGVILTIATGFEILAYVVEDSLGSAAGPIILVVSAAKFALVAMFFMHLKYDSRIFSGIFLFPLALATLVIGGLTLLYHVLWPLR